MFVFYFEIMSGIMDTEEVILSIFFVKYSINLQDEFRLLLTTCNFTINFCDRLTLGGGIVDTKLLLLVVK